MAEEKKNQTFNTMLQFLNMLNSEEFQLQNLVPLQLSPFAAAMPARMMIPLSESFSPYDMPMGMPPADEIDEDMIGIVEDYLKTVINSSSPEYLRTDDLLLKYTFELWRKNKNFPTVDELVTRHLTEHKACIFQHAPHTPETMTLYKKMIAHAIVEFGMVIPCAWLPHFYQFHVLEKRLPTYKEFITMNRNMTQLNNRDPNAEEHKKTPTANIEKLVIREFKDTRVEGGKDTIGDSCAMCQEAFKNGDKCHVFPCGHLFHQSNYTPPNSATEHVSSDDCPGVVQWLKENNTCPVCRKEIVL